MLLDERLPIAADATAGSLTAALAQLGATLIVRALLAAARGDLRAEPQPQGDDPRITYAHKLGKQEAWLDWTLPAAQLARRVRAFDPFPVAAAQIGLGASGDSSLRIWRAEVVHGARAGDAPPGTVLAAAADGVCVATGDGVLRLTEMQRAGGKRLAAREFLAGFPLAAGMRFAAPPAA
jgi:methionyl-tRNA formyltransferase